MTLCKAASVTAILLFAGCAAPQQYACGPALPPITSAAPPAASALTATPVAASTSLAAPPGFTPAAATVPPAPVVVQAPARPPNPLDNVAAMGGR
jgi:hypothetical protein